MSCDKGKGSALEKGNYRGLKLTDQILKIVERVAAKLIRQQIHFGFMWKHKRHFFESYRKNIYQKKKNFYFAFVEFEKDFDQMPCSAVSWTLKKLVLEEWLIKLV